MVWCRQNLLYQTWHDYCNVCMYAAVRNGIARAYHQIWIHERGEPSQAGQCEWTLLRRQESTSSVRHRCQVLLVPCECSIGSCFGIQHTCCWLALKLGRQRFFLDTSWLLKLWPALKCGLQPASADVSAAEVCFHGQRLHCDVFRMRLHTSTVRLEVAATSQIFLEQCMARQAICRLQLSLLFCRQD